MLTDGDKIHDEANNRFSQFFESAKNCALFRKPVLNSGLNTCEYTVAEIIWPRANVLP
jgi:hypothetical protein